MFGISKTVEDILEGLRKPIWSYPVEHRHSYKKVYEGNNAFYQKQEGGAIHRFSAKVFQCSCGEEIYKDVIDLGEIQ